MLIKSQLSVPKLLSKLSLIAPVSKNPSDEMQKRMDESLTYYYYKNIHITQQSLLIYRVNNRVYQNLEVVRKENEKFYIELASSF